MKNKNRKFVEVKSLIFLTIASIFYFISINLFISSAGIFAMGLMSIGNAFKYIFGDNIPFFAISTNIFSILNLPLIIIFWFKVKKSFIVKTSYFVLIQALLGLFIYYFIKDFDKKVVKIIYGFDDSNPIDDIITSFRNQKWTIIVYAIFGSLLSSIATSFIWKMGASTGGTDIIVYYFSYKQKKSISSISFIFSLFFMFISFIFSIVFNKPNNIRTNWVVILIGTISYLIVYIIIMDKIYPKYSKVKIEVFSEKEKEIDQHFKNSKFVHSWNISDFYSGYSSKGKKKVYTIVLLLEADDLAKEILTIDPKAWISITPVKRTYGNFNTSKID